MIQCSECSLHKYRTNIVMGRGSIPAQLLIISEAPGISEDAVGRSAVGRSGKLLDSMVKHSTPYGMEISYYITNCIFCRPCDSLNGPSRQPTKEEILKCSPNLMELIRQVSPRAVVLAGKIAEQIFIKEFPHSYKIQHPSFILKTGGIFSPYFIQNTLILKEAITYALQN